MIKSISALLTSLLAAVAMAQQRVSRLAQALLCLP